MCMVVEMQLLMEEEEANFVRLPPITRESWYPQCVCLILIIFPLINLDANLADGVLQHVARRGLEEKIAQ